jgi:hypothetical protein
VLRATISRRVLPALVVLTASAAPLVAQATKQAGMPGMDHGQSAPAMSASEVAAFAKVEVEIGAVRDTTQAKLAMTRNKKDEIQAALRDTLVNQVAGILKANGLTQADYEKKLFYVSTNGDARHIYDSTFAKLTGQPLPGQLAPSAATLKVPAGEVGVHIGHVVNSFADVPDKKSLLSIAQAEAAVAAQHAALGARASTNLDGMKLHAGHVLNALDPSLQPMGPGKGYGLKKAAAGIATHIDLAAKAPGASQNVIVHANHISTSAKNTSKRVDDAIALCQKIQAATSASDAAALMTQLVSVTSQLQPGFDANGDGRVGWQEGEGGLQQIEEHVKLMLAGEGLGEF